MQNSSKFLPIILRALILCDGVYDGSFNPYFELVLVAGTVFNKVPLSAKMLRCLFIRCDE